MPPRRGAAQDDEGRVMLAMNGARASRNKWGEKQARGEVVGCGVVDQWQRASTGRWGSNTEPIDVPCRRLIISQSDEATCPSKGGCRRQGSKANAESTGHDNSSEVGQTETEGFRRGQTERQLFLFLGSTKMERSEKQYRTTLG